MMTADEPPSQMLSSPVKYMSTQAARIAIATTLRHHDLGADISG
jgi:hypothetical protein